MIGGLVGGDVGGLVRGLVGGDVGGLVGGGLLYTSDAADDTLRVHLDGPRIPNK